MAQPRTLILSDSVPSRHEVGGIWLLDWLRELVPVRTSMYLLDGARAYDHELIPDGLTTCVANVRRRPPPADHSTFSRMQTAVQSAYQRWTCWPRLLREAIRFAQAQRIEQVWAVLDWPAIYYLAPRLARALDVPLIVTVWDPPESILLNGQLDRFSREIALRDFDNAMLTAVGGATMSQGMQRAYAEQYDTPSVILRHTVNPELIQTTEWRELGDEIVIGFSGSLYARREWRAFVTALQQSDWTIAGRPVRLRMLTGRIDEAISGPVRIEWFGWRSTADAVRCLAECDLLYLPFFFAPERRKATEYCFQSKLTTYMAAGRPTFYHAPTYSAPVAFAEEYPVLEACHSLEPSEIAEQLERLLTNRAAQERMLGAIPEALENEFTRAVQRDRLAWLLGLPSAPENAPEMVEPVGALA